MTLSKRLAVATVFVLTSAVTTHGQIEVPDETKNAALRYWMAFAELHDTGADKSIADLLGKTMSGEGAWDETKLGPIVEANMESLGIMQRAAKFTVCGLQQRATLRRPWIRGLLESGFHSIWLEAAVCLRRLLRTPR